MRLSELVARLRRPRGAFVLPPPHWLKVYRRAACDTLCRSSSRPWGRPAGSLRRPSIHLDRVEPEEG